MMKRTISLAILLTAFIFSAQAQKFLTLEDCMKIAEENALTLKQAQMLIQTAEINLKEAKMSRLPSLNGSVSGGLQLGRTIDPTTNDFGTQEIGYNSISLSSGLSLFSGGRINSTVRQGKYNLEAAVYDGEDAYNNLGLTLATMFLQVMLSEDQLANAQNQVRVTEDQYEQSKKLADAGVIPVNDLLDIEAQLALNQQSV